MHQPQQSPVEERLVEEVGLFNDHGVYHLPSANGFDKSIYHQVRLMFRRKIDEVAFHGRDHGVRDSTRTHQLDSKERLALAYSCLRYLHRCITVGDRLLVASHEPNQEFSEHLNLSPAPDTSCPVGSIVIAHPLLIQGSLTQSVIMVVSRSDPSSVVGLVLNRPDGGTIGAIYPVEHLPSVLLPFVECQMFCGGDVDVENAVSYIHLCDDLKGVSVEIQPGLYYSEDLISAYTYVTNTDVNVARSFKVIEFGVAFLKLLHLLVFPRTSGLGSGSIRRRGNILFVAN